MHGLRVEILSLSSKSSFKIKLEDFEMSILITRSSKISKLTNNVYSGTPNICGEDP